MPTYDIYQLEITLSSCSSAKKEVYSHLANLRTLCPQKKCVKK